MLAKLGWVGYGATVAAGTLSAAYAALFGSLALFGPLAPLAFQTMGLEAGGIALLATISAVGRVLAPVWGGRWGDRHGRRQVLLLLAGVSVVLGAVTGWRVETLIVYPLLLAVVASQVPLTDVLVHDALAPETSRFGYVRVWGSVAFALALLGAGAADLTDRPWTLFMLGASLQAVMLVVLLRLPGDGVAARPKVSLRELLAAIQAAGMERFYVATALHYVGFGVYDAYFALRLDALGHGDRAGYAFALGVTAEILLMLVGPRFVRRAGREGARTLAAIGAAAALVRWVIIAGSDDLVLIMAAQPLHAISFGLWYLGIVAYVQARAPEHLKASLQGGSTTAAGIGGLLGTAVGGVVTAQVAPSAAFVLAVGTAALALYLYVRRASEAAGDDVY